MPTDLNFSSKGPWGTLSKALVRSNKATAISLRFSRVRYQSWRAVISASEVEDCGRKPNCRGVRMLLILRCWRMFCLRKTVCKLDVFNVLIILLFLSCRADSVYHIIYRTYLQSSNNVLKHLKVFRGKWIPHSPVQCSDAQMCSVCLQGRNNK